MITEEEKLLVYMKHQPHITMFDINEYVEMYDEGGQWAQPVPYKTDNGKLRRFTFSEYVDLMMIANEDEYDE